MQTNSATQQLSGMGIALAISLAAVIGSITLVQGIARGADAPATVLTPGHPARAASFASYFEHSPVDVSFEAPAYALPLKASDIANLDQAAALGLTSQASALLLKNGFAVTDFALSPECDDVVEAYEALTANQVPVLVTSGSLLHTYHILFDYTLSSIEARDLYAGIWTISLGLFTKSYDTYRSSSGDAKEAALRNAVYLAVGLSLLEPERSATGEPSGAGPTMGGRGGPRIARGPFIQNGDNAEAREFTSEDRSTYKFEVPAALTAQVDAELGLIAKHQGIAPSPLFKYAEDYSQYVPRGHYTVSEKLQRYFRAMMWFGRMSMLLRGSEAIPHGSTCADCEALISTYDARVQSLGACMLASFMANDERLMDLWSRAYEVTAFFVGFSDDLGPYEYIDAVNKVFGGLFEPSSFAANEGAIKVALAEYRAPRIYGGTGNCAIAPPFTPAQADSCLAKTRGFRLMGQRYVPDSYMMSRLVAPYVGPFTGSGLPFTGFDVPGVGPVRVFPRGLDVMALLGSRRAAPILAGLGDSQYKGYEPALAGLRQEMDALDAAAWNQNLYWTWLWVLKGMFAQHGRGYPVFMQGEAWEDRLVTQALASWAELRHDTILYVKQSYTMTLSAILKPVERPQVDGYVEPVPEVYNRLLSLTRMMRKGLDEMGFLEPGQAARFQRLESALGRLVAMSTAELRGGALSREDQDLIRKFADVLDGVLEGLDAKTRKTTMVADVHTDTNSGMVLEEACGPVNLLITAMRIGDEVRLAAGPELTYFEFKQPMADRLTDEAWREMLANRPPPSPEWTRAYSAEAR